MKALFLALSIVFCWFAPFNALASDLGTIVPGKDLVQPLTIQIDKHKKPEHHYAQILDTNFDLGRFASITTNDGSQVGNQSVEVFVEHKDTSYDLFLEVKPWIPAGDYYFVLYTYSIKNDKLIFESQTIETYYFSVPSWILLEEIDLWYPPLSGQHWELNAISYHTFRVAANYNWKLSIRSIQGFPGLHGVFIENNSEINLPVKDIIIDNQLKEVLKDTKTVSEDKTWQVYTLILYLDDITVLPAGFVDILLYLESSIIH